MLTVAEALAAILAEARAGATVQVPLTAGLNRVLAEDVASDIDSPPHRRRTTGPRSMATRSSPRT